MPRGRIARPLPVAELVAGYRAGATTKALAAKYQTSPQTVARRLRSAGVPLRQPQDWVTGRTPVAYDEARLRSLASQEMSTAEIGEAMGHSEEWARRRMVELDLPRLPGKARPSHNVFWRGGRSVDKHGYVLIHGVDHPHATKAGYVREHRLVMEGVLGRYLKPGEVVHHIDGDPGNNAPANLRLYRSNGAHLRDDLAGRVPNWTPEGRGRIRAGSRLAAQRRRASRQE